MWWAVSSSISSSAPTRATVIRSGESLVRSNGRPKVALRQHFQPQPPGLLGQPGQVVFGPAGPQIVADHRMRIAVAVGLA